MADGDTYTITHGKYRGATRSAINKATGTTHTLVAAVAAKLIRVLKLDIEIEGESSEANIVEESNSTVLYGPVECLASTTVTFINIDDKEGVETTTANKALQLTLTNTLPISGTIIYQLINA